MSTEYNDPRSVFGYQSTHSQIFDTQLMCEDNANARISVVLTIYRFTVTVTISEEVCFFEETVTGQVLTPFIPSPPPPPTIPPADDTLFFSTYSGYGLKIPVKTS